MATFYEIDSTRVTIREYLWGTKNPLLLFIGLLLKIFRVRIPGSSDDPNIDSTLGCVVEDFPPEIATGFQTLAGELASHGFCDPVFHFIEDSSTQTRLYWATFRHVSGQHCARIHHRFWGKAQKHDRGVFPVFITGFTDGTFLMSSAGKPDVAAPESIQMNRMPGANVAKLWSEHERLAGVCSGQKQILPARNRHEVIEASERLHLLQRDFHLARGFFRQRTEKEQKQAELFSEDVEKARATGTQFPEAMAELVRLQEKKPKWSSGIWVLLVSAVAFLGAGAARWNWQVTLWLIPILLFHELGHWVAMRIFRYRNLRMFFIPFFGAAVTGQNWNVPGWKKALVSLAGPLPGIALGIGLGTAAMITDHAFLKQAALMLILINAFNLLPVLPLDGGHFLHSTLFCRNRWLDIAFRGLAVASLLALSVFGMGKLFLYLGIVFGIALPVAFKLGKITDRFRKEPLPPPLPGEDRIPAETAENLIAAVKSELPKNASNKVLAQHTLNIFETLNARPPGALASVGLLALYSGAIIGSLVCGTLLIISRESSLGGFFRAAINQPQHKISCTDTAVWRGDAFDLASARNLIVTTFDKPQKAQTGFRDLTNQFPETAEASLFGDSLLLSLPLEDDAAREQWFDKLQRLSTNTFVVVSNNALNVSFTFIAPDSVAATNIEDELLEYFDSATTMNLIPPWHPSANSEEYASFRKARKVWKQIGSEIGKAWEDSSVKSFSTRMAAAERRGAKEESKQLATQQHERMLEVQAETRARLKEKYATTAYAPLVALEEELSKTPYTNQTARAAIYKRISGHLGQLENAPDKRVFGGFGMVNRNGLLFQAPWVSVANPASGLPQILDWLCRQNCTHVQYELIGALGGFEGED